MYRFIKYIIACVTFLIVVGSSSTVVKAEDKMFEDNENGIVTIRYNNKDNVKMKVRVSKDKKNYYYNLFDGENEIDIPLNMGNGSYTIKILKNIVDNRYSVVTTTEISLDLKDDEVVYTESNVIVDFELTDKSIEKANSLTKYCRTEEEVINVIYKYVIQNFVYDYDHVKQKASTYGYIPDIEVVYKNKEGICYDISAIMAAMMRSQGIKVKLVMGYTPNISGYHAWNSVYNEEEEHWFAIDGTYDIGMKRLKRKYYMVKKASNYEDIKYEY